MTLECRVSGRPAPTITWFREDYQIQSSIDFQTSFSDGLARMLIREAFAEDSGRFSCTASSKAGTVSTSCHLLVKGEDGGTPFNVGLGLLQLIWSRNGDPRRPLPLPPPLLRLG